MGYVTMNRTEGIYSKTLQIAEEKSSLWHPHPKNSIITRTLALTITLTLYDQNHQINMFIIKYTNSIDFWVGRHKEILPSRNFFLLVHLDQRSRWTIAITWRPSSVVCKLFTFQASSPKPLGRLEPNLAGMFLGWSSTKLLFFVPVGYSIWLPRPIICSDWPKFQRFSSLKLMNWLNPNCTGMIIGMSFTKLLFFMPIGNPRWPPSQDID